MDSRHVFSIAVKDLREAFSSISIYGPMFGIPLFFAFTLPAFTAYIAQSAGPGIASKILGIAVLASAYQSGKLSFMIFFSINVLGPIFLTMPIITASVIAADSFAGEKERKTAESLLSTPTSDLELILGKVLASFIPAVVMTVIVFIIFGWLTNYFSLQYFSQAIFPNISWFMMLANSPFLALTTIGLVVLVSARVKNIKEAQQISALLILPILVIPFIAVFNIATLDFWFLFEMLLALIGTSTFVLWLSIKSFNRERFITV